MNIYVYMYISGYLAGGFKQFLCPIIYGNNPSQLTFIFFRGVETNNQLSMCVVIIDYM